MVSYANMKLKVDTTTKSVDLGNGTIVEVLKYIPIKEKYNLINTVLLKSYDDGIYNPVKMDMYFALNLIYLYSNISFTEKQKEDEEKIYDTLQSNGVMDKIIDTIEDEEYNNIYTMLVETEDKYNEYRKTIAGMLNDFSKQLNENADLLKQITESFDPSQFQNVLDFAQAANGGRPIE